MSASIDGRSYRRVSALATPLRTRLPRARPAGLPPCCPVDAAEVPLTRSGGFGKIFGLGYEHSVSSFGGRFLANSVSAKKRMRQERKRRLHNRAQRSRIKTAIKRVMSAGDPESGQEALKEAYVLLDRLAARRYLHRNRAARKKSQLAKHVARLGT